MTDVLKTSRLTIVIESLMLVVFVHLIAAATPGIGIVINIGGSISSSFSFLIVPGIVGYYVFSEVDPETVDDLYQKSSLMRRRGGRGRGRMSMNKNNNNRNAVSS